MMCCKMFLYGYGRGLENFKEESQLYTWLYRIATNESLTLIENAKKRGAVSLSDVESG